MKLIACTLPLLVGVPSVVAAQVNVSLARFQRPVVRATLGPVAVVATLGGHGVSVRAAPAVASASASSVLATAKRYLGAHYHYGGESPAEGFDCSGFVQYVYGRHGINLPRTSRLQAAAGRPVPRALESLRPGDLLLFASTGTRINHVAIYVGSNRILHSSAGAGRVVYDDLSTPRGQWYLRHHVASRRVL